MILERESDTLLISQDNSIEFVGTYVIQKIANVVAFYASWHIIYIGKVIRLFLEKDMYVQPSE